MKKIPMAAMLALAAFALPVSAATYYVNSDTGEDVDPKVNKKAGLSEGAAFKTIQFAIDKAAAGSTILVAPGEYGAIKSNNKKLTIKAVEGLGSVTLQADEDYPWIADLGAWGTQQLYGTSYQFSNKKWSSVCMPWMIESGLDGIEYSEYGECGVNWETILDEALAAGDEDFEDDWWMRKCKDVAIKGVKYPRWKGGSATKIFGFVFFGGEGGVAGGTLESCSIVEASNMAATESSLTDCTITGCMAEYGTYGDCGYWETYGGVLVKDCTLVRSELSYNECMAISAWSDFKNCLITSNGTGDMWGGFLFNCVVAQNGSGSFMDTTLYNCTVAYNKPSENYDYSSLEEVFIPDENGPYYHEGNNGYWGTIGEPTLKGYGSVLSRCKVFNSIVRFNFGDDGVEYNVDIGQFRDTYETNYNAKGKAVVTRYDPSSQFVNSCTDVLIDSSKNKKVKSTGNIAADPCFIGWDDYRLSPWSQCVNKGADYTKQTGKFDLDGAARKVGAKVDMGAYELQASTPVPADYDGDGITDAALCFADTGDWWIWGSQSAIDSGATHVYLPMPKGATPIAADFDGTGFGSQPGFFAGAEKQPFFVHLDGGIYGEPVTNSFATYKDAKGKAVSTKGATPVAARLKAGAPATFGIYASTVAAPVYVFENGLTYGGNSKIFAKGSKPVVADFTGDTIDDLGAYTSAAAKPAFTVLRSDEGYSLTAPFTLAANFFYPTARQSIPLGAKGALPCVADYDGDGLADFATYSSTAAAPEFTRLLSSSKYSETRTMPIGSKGDIPVVGNYENAAPAAANMAVFTGSTWRYCDSGYEDEAAVGWPALATE